MSEPILFREILQQHQALSQRGWAIVFVALGVFFSSFGLVMFVKGAWPVIGFPSAIEIGALYVGCRVMIARTGQTAGRGHSHALDAQPASSATPKADLQRRELSEHDECARVFDQHDRRRWDDPVVLRAGNRRIPFGGDLNPDQRQ